MSSTQMELYNTMTVQEVADTYGITRDAVHKAMKSKANPLPARQSARTWLIHRLDAESRWGGNRD